ncbi:MAG: addiction module protein [Immundisolibacteraceae bacterium]|nr:addiction module protein [Immundisolibacteraceae bacterium]
MNLQSLTQSEKILLAEKLWDSVAADQQLLPLTSEQKSELDTRLANYYANPEAGEPWDKVRNRISRP